MVGAVVRLGDADYPQQAVRAVPSQLPSASVAEGEVLPAALFEKRTGSDIHDRQRGRIIRDQEIESAQVACRNRS